MTHAIAEREIVVAGKIASTADLVAAIESRAQRGRKGRYRSKILRPLLALRGRWNGSLARIVAGECRRFFPRIAAIQRTPNLKLGVAIPMDPTADSDSYSSDRSFSLACSDYIQQQWAQHPWVGPLDAQMLGLAFGMGAEWCFRNRSNAACNAGRRS
jgi:hypothetical protein